MVFIDLETTGVKPIVDRILSVAIVAPDGRTLFDTLINPARAFTVNPVNGITPDMVAGAPTIEQVRGELIHLLGEQTICAYNAEFDLDWIGVPECCMNRFARFMGEPSSKDYHTTGFKTHKLSAAVQITGYEFQATESLHGALTDARVCRHVWLWLDQRPAGAKYNAGDAQAGQELGRGLNDLYLAMNVR
jgi:DNA polymerase III epsilon subunit-like protein